MEKKTTVHPIILTAEQLEMLKQLVKPSIEYDDDGDINIWAEDENAMNAAQIYRQCELADANELQFVWCSIYDVHRAHGGPEEGGWGYDHWNLRWTTAIDCVDELVKRFNKLVVEFAAEIGMPFDEAVKLYITEKWVDEVQHSVDTSLTYLKGARFREDAYNSVYLVIEVTPGAESTIHKPIWR